MYRNQYIFGLPAEIWGSRWRIQGSPGLPAPINFEPWKVSQIIYCKTLVGRPTHLVDSEAEEEDDEDHGHDDHHGVQAEDRPGWAWHDGGSGRGAGFRAILTATGGRVRVHSKIARRDALIHRVESRDVLKLARDDVVDLEGRLSVVFIPEIAEPRLGRTFFRRFSAEHAQSLLVITRHYDVPTRVVESPGEVFRHHQLDARDVGRGCVVLMRANNGHGLALLGVAGEEAEEVDEVAIAGGTAREQLFGQSETPGHRPQLVSVAACFPAWKHEETKNKS